MPLKTLANALTALLIGDLILAAAVRFVEVRSAGPSWSAPVRADQKPFIVVARIALLVTEIVFLAWFRRAVVNAESGGRERRYGRAWSFWGWAVPVVNFWIPFQLMDDLLRDSRPGWPQGRKTWLPLAWWSSWILFVHAEVVQHGSLIALAIGLPAAPRYAGPPDSWTRFFLFTVAGLTCIALVRAISASEPGASGTPGAEVTAGAPGLAS
ncbi:MAG: DUF4328 domain-containing protein [Streptosporangiaceae bacterium]